MNSDQETELLKKMKEHLNQLYDPADSFYIRRITGGSINKVYAVQTKKQTYLLKVNHQAPARFFECEAAGLDEIKNTQTINVPEVFAYKDRRTEGEAGYLLAEWIQGEKTKDTERMLGEKLAALHSFPVPKKYGLEQDNFIGSLPQLNGIFSSWTVYFLKKRILPQVERETAETGMHTARKQKLYKLMERMEKVIPEYPRASLLHGDLWGGNWITGKNGEPVLIDPAVLYGHHEMDLAFTELFGGFSSDFYQAYTHFQPLDQEYQDRKGLYQLFYLLVHLNLFGEAYGPPVDRILKKYLS